MSSTYGERIKMTIFGQSHGAAIGVALDGIPAGLPVDIDKLQAFLSRRAPGNAEYATTRKERDEPQFLAGIVDGHTCGAPICATITNTNTRSGDYANLNCCPRPGHADYTAQIKYGGFQDSAGGGHFSGRLTASLCIAGGMCIQWLEAIGIKVYGHICAIGGVQDTPCTLDPVHPEADRLSSAFPVIDASQARKMQEKIAAARADGDSVGGIIECVVTGLPSGIGGPMFNGMENRLAQILFGIPAVKGVEFGAGFHCANLLGSENNDPFVIEDGAVKTASNHAGGILGGITTGMPLTVRVAVKPTPSISMPQQTVNLSTMESAEIAIKGRHDPCIVPRAVPAVEAAVAIAVYDAVLSEK